MISYSSALASERREGKIIRHEDESVFEKVLADEIDPSV